MSASPLTPVYLDHAAATPIRPAALEAMTAALMRVGNASSLHGSGRQARRTLEEARESIAASLGARPSEVIFTGGGTEADNLAMKGIYWARRGADPRRTRIVLSAVEHHAILDPAQWLAEHEGAQLTVLGVDDAGRVDPAQLRSVLTEHGDEVALVSVMWANNEVGTIAPIAELASVAHEFDVPFHTDAIAAVGHVPVDFSASGVDAMSVAAHKFGGPPGVGALLLGRAVATTPLAHGGGHERDVRSGTPDVPAARGMAVALAEAVSELGSSMKHVAVQRDRLAAGVAAATERCVVNAEGADRLPGIAHVRFDDCEGDSLLMLLDAQGIECSTGSACTAGVARASHVLLAMGVSANDARGSLRFSLSEATTEADVDRVIAAIGDVVARARAAGAPRELVGER